MGRARNHRGCGRQDPAKRASADQILQHPWMKEHGTASSEPLDNIILKRMQVGNPACDGQPVMPGGHSFDQLCSSLSLDDPDCTIVEHTRPRRLVASVLVWGARFRHQPAPSDPRIIDIRKVVSLPTAVRFCSLRSRPPHRPFDCLSVSG